MSMSTAADRSRSSLASGEELATSAGWEEADAWLNELYSGQPVPTHDRSDMTLQAVLELQKKSDMANRVMKTVLDIHHAISEDTARQATLWQERLEALEITKASMSVQGARSLEALSTLAIQLGLEDTATSSYHTAVAHVTMRLMDARLERESGQETEELFRSRVQKARTELSSMKEMLSSLRRTHSKDRPYTEQQNAAQELQKENEASQRAYADLLNEYEAVQVEQQGLRLEAIQRLEQDTLELELALAEKSKQVGRYGDLPPDMILSSLKMKDTQERLRSLQLERERLLADIAESVR
ncbi:hypothetical protein BCR43DRAFT_489877 [Syncephalastrum racemosum]|uniref:Uncharacterized protein n=1 Tax=Syncephalastrum racemosum TaxID=13706 RepID=A0A1X2HF00_SYNRA|nr:hypothetical protein BCR43DRAFT_489877 [Syncephalastrum racemosum]